MLFETGSLAGTLWSSKRADRAEYGSKLLKRLSQLKIKGCSERGLALYCKFYNEYSDILQTLSTKSEILAKIINDATPEIGRTVSYESLGAVMEEAAGIEHKEDS